MAETADAGLGTHLLGKFWGFADVLLAGLCFLFSETCKE